MATNDKQRATLFLDPNLLKQAKMQAVIKEMSLSALLEEALIKFLPRETTIRKAEVKTDFNPKN